MQISRIVETAIKESLQIKSTMLMQQKDVIAKISNIVIDALRRGNRIYLFGNGGSAADAQHIAGELQGKFFLKRRPLPVIALTTNTSSLTAIGNDYGFEYVFERQVEAMVREGDVIIAISTSGKSRNVIRAVKAAKKAGALTIGFSGRTGGMLGKIVDVCLKVPSENVARIQECHILAGHIICEAVEEAMFGK